MDAIMNFFGSIDEVSAVILLFNVSVILIIYVIAKRVTANAVLSFLFAFTPLVILWGWQRGALGIPFPI